MGTIGQRLRDSRQEAGLTLEQAGAIAGVSKQGISQIERGVTKNPEAATLEPLCRRLGVSLQWVMSGKGPRHLNSSLKAETALPNREGASQSLTIDADILHEAITLIVFDEATAGAYPPRSHSRRLAELYARVAADGGKLTDAHNDAFVNEVNAREKRHVAAPQPVPRRRANGGR
jgi:transcriptional regulator with XRE-family HTH domain